MVPAMLHLPSIVTIRRHAQVPPPPPPPGDHFLAWCRHFGCHFASAFQLGSGHSSWLGNFPISQVYLSALVGIDEVVTSDTNCSC